MTKNILISFLILSSCASVDTESPYTGVFMELDHTCLIESKMYQTNLSIVSYSFAIVSSGRSPEYR